MICTRRQNSLRQFCIACKDLAADPPRQVHGNLDLGRHSLRQGVYESEAPDRSLKILDCFSGFRLTPPRSAPRNRQDHQKITTKRELFKCQLEPLAFRDLTICSRSLSALVLP